MRVALTGGIGSGKSEAARLLARHGAVVIDADALAREVVQPGSPGLAAIVEEFGADVLLPDGSLDRSALAAIVFSDAAALQRLNEITHPLVAERSRELQASAPAGSIIVYDVPLLAESNRTGEWDLVVVVDAPDDVRIDRLIDRGMTEADARARMAAQASRADRLAIADEVLDNSGDRAHLAEAVDRLWARLTS